jgi:hypothetical protein
MSQDDTFIRSENEWKVEITFIIGALDTMNVSNYLQWLSICTRLEVLTKNVQSSDQPGY